MASDKDDRQVWISGPHLVINGFAGEIGEGAIEDGQVDGFAFEDGEGIVSTGGAEDLITLALKPGAKEIQDEWIVVNQKNFATHNRVRMSLSLAAGRPD
jgi:hypothetical protein